MKTRKSALCALGLAAAMTLGGAVSASAQDTTRTRSQTRIPVRKDQGTAATPMARTDTVTVRVTDTVRMTIRDTVTTIRTDTVVRIQELPIQRLPGLFFGLGGGVAVPMNNWRNSTKDGPTISGRIGYFPMNSPLGIRASADYAMFSTRDSDCNACPDPKLISGSADVILRFPLDRTSVINPVLYFLGGGGLDKFTDFLPYRNSTNEIVTAGKDTYLTYPGIPLTAATAGDKSLFYHWDVGTGVEFKLGPANLFVEGKYTTIMTENGNSHYWPIVVGLNFF
jgi:hypothetical protein